MAYKTDFLGHIKFCIWGRAVTAAHITCDSERTKEIEDMKSCSRNMLQMTLGNNKTKTNAFVAYKLEFILNETEALTQTIGPLLFKNEGNHYLPTIAQFKIMLHIILLNFSSYDFWYQRPKS
jgi:hypothetical protein